MTDTGKRRYTSPVRDEQAARTRGRILDAAAALFESRGYGATSIRAVADRAGVAADTVYAVFGTKARLLTALVDARLGGDTGVANLLDRPEAVAIRDERDQRRQIHRFARFVASLVEAAGPVYEILRTASAAGPDMAALHAEMDGYRLRNMRQVAVYLAARGPLRVDVERAGEVIWVLASPDVSRMLRHGRRWSREQHAGWLEDVLTRALLP